MYESLRNTLISSLVDKLTRNDLNTVLAALDSAVRGYDINRKCTDLAITNGVPEALKLYLAAKAVQNLASGTLKNYNYTLRHFFETVKTTPDKVTTNDIRLYLFQYKATHGIKDSTIDGLRICLNSFFSWCTDEDLIMRNPVRRVEVMRKGEPERLPMSAIELEKVRYACKNIREKALVDFLFSSACRVSECSNMNIDRVNFTDRTIRVEHGKGDKGRTTFLNAEAEVSLRAYLAARKDDNPALFVSGRYPYNRLGVKAIQNEVTKIVSRVNLTVHVTPHIFRHTAATMALQRGMPIEQVQRYLGHAKIETTLRYAKILYMDVKASHERCIA